MVAALAIVLLAPPVVYPDPVGVRFDHARHDLPCAKCHSGAATSTRAGDDNLPGLKICRECHPDAKPFARRPASAVRFSHQAHRTQACADCHADFGLPAKPVCTACHANQPDQCAKCHLSRPDGLLVTKLSGGSLRPASHGPDFSTGHSVPARANPGECAVCHTQNQCAKCHDGVQKPIGIHPGDYILAHGADARAAANDCSSCHRQQTFCVDCHTRSGVVDRPGPDDFSVGQATRRDFHPPGFRHAFAARRNLAECVSCHQEESCTRCHSSQAAPQLRASPHPSGFRSQCRTLRDASERGCLKCHGSRAELDRLCR